MVWSYVAKLAVWPRFRHSDARTGHGHSSGLAGTPSAACAIQKRGAASEMARIEPPDESWSKALLILFAVLSASAVTLIYIGRWWGATEYELLQQRSAIRDVGAKIDEKVLPKISEHDARLGILEMRRHRSGAVSNDED